MISTDALPGCATPRLREFILKNMRKARALAKIPLKKHGKQRETGYWQKIEGIRYLHKIPDVYFVSGVAPFVAPKMD